MKTEQDSDESDISNSNGLKKLLCHSCQINLKNLKFINVDFKNLCLSCFEMEYANRCFVCKKRIRIDQMEIKFKDFYWHDHCFNCSLCGASVANRCFAFNNNILVCPPCYEKEVSLECSKCNQKFENGQLVFEFEGSYWHENCMRCICCDFPVNTKPFIQLPPNKDLICLECYEKNGLKLCKKCGQAIKSDGVECFETHEQWHRDCFVCNGCGKHMFEFVSEGIKDYACTDKDIFCGECYLKKFFRKCYRCDNDIEGSKQTKFINFENMNWHARCFSCYKCNSGLTDKGFVIVGLDIWCPSCAKSKFC